MVASRNTPTGLPREFNIQVMGVGDDVVADVEDLRDTEDTRPNEADGIYWDETLQLWIYRPLAAGDLPPHALGGDRHTESTLGELNTLVSDANLDAAGTPRPPTVHGPTHVDPLLDPIQYATAAQRGLMSNIAQTFAGVKTFNNRVNSPSHSILTRRIECEVFTSAGVNACLAELGADGGEVYIPQGTVVCTESIVIPADNITLRGAGKGTILDASAGQAFHVIDVGTHHRCVIKDLQIIGNTGEPGTFDLINGNGCTHTTISGCYLSDADYRGIYLTAANDSLIENNFVSGCGRGGIEVQGLTRAKISGNTLTANSVHGISVGTTAYYVKVVNNYLHDNGTYSLFIRGDFADVRGNTIRSPGFFGIYVTGAPSSKIIDNTIYEVPNVRNDIYIIGASHKCIIALNHCYATAGNAERAIYVDASTECIISLNESEGHDTCGIELTVTATGCSIGGNILLDAVPMIDNGSGHLYRVYGALRAGAVANYFNVSESGDSHYVGSAGMPYGEIWVLGNAVATAIGVAGTFVQFLGFANDGSFNNTTPAHAQDHIEIDIAGDYLCVCSFHVESIGAGAADVVSIEVRKNNGTVAYNNLHAHRKLAGGGGDIGSISISGILPNLAVNDTIEVWLTNDSNATDILVADANLTITQIGGAG